MSMKFFLAPPPDSGFRNDAINPEKIVMVSTDHDNDPQRGEVSRICFKTDTDQMLYWYFRDYAIAHRTYWEFVAQMNSR